MLVRHVQERQTVSCSFAPHHYCCITLAAHQVSQSAALRFSSHFLLLLTFVFFLPHHLMSLAPHPSFAILTRPCRGPQKTIFYFFYFCPPLITLPSLILLFRARDMPLRTFPKFLEIWLQERLRAGMPLPLVFRGKPLCAHTHSRAHTPHGSPECPVIRLCFDLDTHREEKH